MCVCEWTLLWLSFCSFIYHIVIRLCVLMKVSLCSLLYCLRDTDESFTLWPFSLLAEDVTETQVQVQATVPTPTPTIFIFLGFCYEQVFCIF